MSIPIVFTDVYKFNLGQVGLVYNAQIVGSFIAMPISLYCDRLYRNHFDRTGPEGRMYAGMCGGILVSVAAWQFAWTSWPAVHWVVPILGIVVLYSGLLQIYLTAFNYVTDAYAAYAASALAASESALMLIGLGRD